MTNKELEQLMEEIKKSYNMLLEKIVEDVKPTMSAEEAVMVAGRKEGAEMALVLICNTILACYGVEANLELSNGQTVTLGSLRND